MTPVHDSLAEFIARQRWFAGGEGPVQVVGVHRLAALSADPLVEVFLVDVTSASDPPDTEPATYQVLVETTDHLVERLEHVRISPSPADVDPVVETFQYDALHDREVTGLLLRLIADGARLGDLACYRVEGAPIELDRPSLVFTGEQSNTSLAYGDSMVLKVYRRVVPGVNPDVEVHVALAQVGCPHVPRPLGWVDSAYGVLAFLQEYLSGATEGWGTAQASVRDLFVEADLHPAECGGDFGAEAERLGVTTAEVHAALREAFGVGELSPAELSARVDVMRRRLSAAVDEVPALVPYAGQLTRAYDELASLGAEGRPMQVQRVHGDFHLGQTLRTPSGWKILDFEGEPATPVADRRALDTPLRDVAGMLRSLDYAARIVLLDHPDDPQLAYRAAEWVDHNANAFCEGYASVTGHDPRGDSVLLRALETEKAVYEVVYESRMRPTWATIPMAAIERLAR